MLGAGLDEFLVEGDIERDALEAGAWQTVFTARVHLPDGISAWCRLALFQPGLPNLPIDAGRLSLYGG